MGGKALETPLYEAETPEQAVGNESLETATTWATFLPDLLSIMMLPVLLGLTTWGVARASSGVEVALRLAPVILPIVSYLYGHRLRALVLEPGQHAVSVFEMSWLGAWPQVTDDNRGPVGRVLQSYTHWNLAWMMTIMTALQVHISHAAPDFWVALQIWWDILALLVIHIIYRFYFFVRARRVA